MVRLGRENGLGLAQCGLDLTGLLSCCEIVMLVDIMILKGTATYSFRLL